MKVTFHVACGSNEQVVAEMDVKDVAQWDERVLPVLKKIEQRVGDRARRIIEGNKQMHELMKRDPALANLCHNIILVCLGQMVTVDDTGLVDKTWDVPAEAKLQAPEAVEPVAEAA